MPKIHRAIAIAALYLLLAFLDEFVLVRLLVTRIGVPLLLAAFEALAAIGAGFIVRGLRGRVWRVDDETARAALALDLILGVPIFGTLCFLIGTIHVSSWTMTPPLVVLGLAGAYAVARHCETRAAVVPATTGKFAIAAIALAFVCAVVAAQEREGDGSDG